MFFHGSKKLNSADEICFDHLYSHVLQWLSYQFNRSSMHVKFFTVRILKVKMSVHFLAEGRMRNWRQLVFDIALNNFLQN